jgi:IS5 family transposase
MGGWSERVMGQKGFFDVERRLEAISANGDALETIKKMVRWEDFRADIEAVTETKPEERKSNAGRKPYDTILKFKIVVLQSLHNLSDEQSEYLIRDRISFMRFLDLELEDPVPDATTIWLFREALAEAGLIDKLFERFGQHLEAEGYIARGGQLKQRNTKEENEAIKAGKTPEGWEKQPAKNAQKDKDARWTKKNDESFYGYKNHVGVDKAHKLIRKWDATDAAVHDSQKLDDVLDLSNTGKGVWADSAYRSVQIEAGLKEKGLQSRIHRRAARNCPLSERQKSANTTRSKVRARVEHVFRPPAGLDLRQDRAHHRYRAGEIKDRDDEPRLQYPPAGSARADGGCVRLSALTGGIRVASCKDRAVTGQAPKRPLHPLAQLRQKSPKAGIVRGAYISA